MLVPLALAALRSAADIDLVSRLKQRDPKAAADLYDRYGRVVFSLVARMVRDPAIAEDLVQETMLRVFNRLQFFDAERGSFGAWLLAVARNQAVDYLRSAGGKQRQSELFLEGIDDPSLFSDLGVGESEILRFENVRKVKEALARLTENQRMVIELAYFEGLSQTEMAERLQQPLGTVKTWVRSALRVMRESLTEAVPA
ncbi:MAG: sigma-70 family RNA polymerase sigma factor [Bryobacterales bacterium]|nr:sigma-70 family RNA polymerase sigma factor [Bryobacterales bacterium]